jgi:hypothetical protein
MSVSGIIDPSTGKIYPQLITGNTSIAQTLGEVLSIGSSANNPITGLAQDATDFKVLGCEEIETSKVYMGNQPFLQIGETNDKLIINGAITKGSMLIGNGVETKELVVGANGLVLSTNSSAPYGVEWAVGGGGGGVATVSANLNISISGTATNPIISVADPLNATLNLGTQNTTGTIGALIYDNPSTNNKSTLTSTSLIINESTFATGDQIQTFYNGYSAIGTTDSTIHSKTGLSKTLGSTALTISSTTAPIQITPNIGTNCNVTISGTGNFQVNQSSTGGATQPATSVINTNGGANPVHIDLYKNSASPANNDGIGAISYHANNASGTKVEYARIQADQRDNTTGSENGSVSVYVAQNSATAIEYLRVNGQSGYNELYRDLNTRGQNITTSTTQLNLLNPTNNGTTLIQNTGTNSAIQLITTASSSQIILQSTSICSLTSTTNNINITANQAIVLSATNSIVQVPQSGSTIPKLSTDLTNVIYYPTYLVDNNNTNSVSIPPPQIQGERLTLVNKGVTPLSVWTDYSSSFGVGAYAVYVASSGYIWIARTDSNVISVYDSTLVNILGNITLTGWAERAYCFYEAGGYIYIGGSFQAVNGNATGQYGITRVNASNFIEDPIYDNMNNFYGVDCGGGGQGVYCLHDYNGNLYCGGSFTNFYPTTTTCNYLFYIYNYTGSSSNQTYYEGHGGTNGKVNTLLSSNGYLFVGGDFTLVNYQFSPINYQYLATWNGGAWDYVGGNAFNGAVNVINNTNNYPYLIVGGFFSSPFPYICYIDYTFPNNYPTDTYLSVNTGINRNCIFYNGSINVFTTNQGVFQSSTFQLWSNLGSPYSGDPSFIGYFSGEYKVAYTNYSFFQTKSTVSQVASFVLTSGNFKFNTTSYTTAILSMVDLGWDFVGDMSSGAIWRATTYNPWGSYS